MSTILSARELLVDARWSPALGAALASSLLRASVPFLVRADRLTLEHCFGEPSAKNNSGETHSFGYLSLLHRQLREREREYKYQYQNWLSELSQKYFGHLNSHRYQYVYKYQHPCCRQ